MFPVCYNQLSPQDDPLNVTLSRTFTKTCNSYVHAFPFLVYFFTILYNTTTWNDQSLCSPENMHHSVMFLVLL